MAECKHEKVQEPDDPRRCQGLIGGRYQCFYVSVEGTHFCPSHSAGSMSRVGEQRRNEYNYNLAKYRARVIDFAEHPKVKSLREEVGVLRLLLETLLNRIKDDSELMLYSGKICDMVTRVDKVVTSCHTLEAKTGQVLDKTSVINLAEGVIQIINKYINDPDILFKISTEIGMLLETNNKQTVS